MLADFQGSRRELGGGEYSSESNARTRESVHNLDMIGSQRVGNHQCQICASMHKPISFLPLSNLFQSLFAQKISGDRLSDPRFFPLCSAVDMASSTANSTSCLASLGRFCPSRSGPGPMVSPIEHQQDHDDTHSDVLSLTLPRSEAQLFNSKENNIWILF
jgi:hypothetical protein